ncbi:MAG: hypothetical protein ACT4OJ_10945 [Bacteroidota bacterium]
MKKKKPLSATSVVWIVILAVCLVLSILTAIGATNTFWGYDARHSSVGGKVVMVICNALVAYLLWAAATGRISIQGYAWAGVAAILGFGYVASADFKFTAGDIKQRITYLDNQGRVADTAVLFDCYENFYHFNDNPELKEYVLKYGELPGRNRWNAFILAGDIPKSTAPMADEDFKWHTGAYEMDLKERGCK